MKLELSVDQLKTLLAKQLENLFLFDADSELAALNAAVDTALARCETCFGQTPNKYYQRDNQAYFNPYHSGQYTIYLYFVSRALFESGRHRTLADRVYYLNRSLNSVDLFYEVALPDIFFLDHPLGSVMGRANYGERFSFTQQCTVGNNQGVFPNIGNNVKMMSGAKIIGQCTIGDNVIIAANSYVKDCDIPACSLVFGSSPNLNIVSKPENYFNA